MKLEIIQKEDVERMIKNFAEYGLMSRKTAARYLDMPLTTFDDFIRSNPHLKLTNEKTRSPRFCPKMLKEAYRSAS